MPLSEKEQHEINTLVGRFEAATDVDALAGVIQKADAYPAIPWKAFAVGCALGVSAFVARRNSRRSCSSGDLPGLLPYRQACGIAHRVVREGAQGNENQRQRKHRGLRRDRRWRLRLVVELGLQRRRILGRGREFGGRRKLGKLVSRSAARRPAIVNRAIALKLQDRRAQASVFMRSMKCLRNLATFGATTNWQ